MLPTVYENMLLLDTSAVIALHDKDERFHPEAVAFFDRDEARHLRWFVVNITSHETFTRVRYGGSLEAALARYDFLRSAGSGFRCLSFDEEDERQARLLLAKYKDQRLSFHDALCAAVMKREGIFRVFSFDWHFSLFGFEVLPGPTH